MRSGSDSRNRRFNPLAGLIETQPDDSRVRHALAIADAVLTVADRALEEAGINLIQLKLLLLIEQGNGEDVTGNLAVRLDRAGPTAFQAVQCLINSGFIEQSKIPGQRSRRLGLTPDGREALGRYRSWANALLQILGSIGLNA